MEILEPEEKNLKEEDLVYRTGNLENTLDEDSSIP